MLPETMDIFNNQDRCLQCDELVENGEAFCSLDCNIAYDQRPEKEYIMAG